MTGRRLTHQEVLDRVDQLSVWGQMIGVYQLNRNFCSPFRDDKKPRVRLVLNKGRVMFSDFGGGVFMDCIEGYRLFRSQATYGEALEAVLRMGGTGAGGRGTTVSQVKSGKIKETKWVESYKIVPFGKEGLDFWAKRGLNESDLGMDGMKVHEIRGYRTSNKSEAKSFDRECFGFVYEIEGKFKRYCPGKEGYEKFGGSVNRDSFWHLKRGSDTLLITKSNKDMLVWVKYSRSDLCAFGSESTHPTDEKLKELTKGYNKVTICFDPDPAGFKAAQNLQNRIEQMFPFLTVKIWNWPDPKTKDLDGFRCEHSEKQTRRFIGSKNSKT